MCIQVVFRWLFLFVENNICQHRSYCCYTLQNSILQRSFSACRQTGARFTCARHGRFILSVFRVFADTLSFGKGAYPITIPILSVADFSEQGMMTKCHVLHTKSGNTVFTDITAFYGIVYVNFQLLLCVKHQFKHRVKFSVLFEFGVAAD